MTNILYISLTGMTEPLGRSQVLEYLADLSKKNKFYLISFEREDDLKQIEEIQDIVNKYHIEWHYLIYSNKYGVFSTMTQIVQAIKLGSKLIKQNGIKIVHARSMIPATMGWLLKKLYHVKLLFDIRGFAIDEKVDSGRLKKNSLFFKILKKLDDYLYKTSDHIVILTHAAKEILHNRLDISHDKLTVIPTCANKNLFKKIDKDKKLSFKTSLGYTPDDKVIIHTGTVSGWYDFESEVKLVKEMMRQDEHIYFLVLNKNEQLFIKETFSRLKFPKDRVKITSSSFEQMYMYLNMADASLFFIKPSFSKQASAPTKFAENVACYLPSITNADVGDMNLYLSQYDVGVVVDMKKLDTNIESVAQEILENISKEKDEKEFKNLFDKHFDKKMAVQRYQDIYDELVGK